MHLSIFLHSKSAAEKRAEAGNPLFPKRGVQSIVQLIRKRDCIRSFRAKSYSLTWNIMSRLGVALTSNVIVRRYSDTLPLAPKNASSGWSHRSHGTSWAESRHL